MDKFYQMIYDQQICKGRPPEEADTYARTNRDEFVAHLKSMNDLYQMIHDEQNENKLRNTFYRALYNRLLEKGMSQLEVIHWLVVHKDLIATRLKDVEKKIEKEQAPERDLFDTLRPFWILGKVLRVIRFLF